MSLVKRAMSRSISFVDSPTVVLIARVVSPTLLPLPVILSGSVGISIISYVWSNVAIILSLSTGVPKLSALANAIERYVTSSLSSKLIAVLGLVLIFC